MNYITYRAKPRKRLLKHICKIEMSSEEFRLLTKSLVIKLDIIIELAEVQLITSAENL